MRDHVGRPVRINRQVNAGRKRSPQANIRDSRRCSSRFARSKCLARQIVRRQHERAGANHPAQKIAPTGSHIVFMQRVDRFAVAQRNIFDGDHETLRFFGDFQTIILPPFRILATGPGTCSAIRVPSSRQVMFAPRGVFPSIFSYFFQIPNARRKSTICPT